MNRSRTFFFCRIERDALTFLTRAVLRRFVEVKHISFAGDQEAQAFQLTELIAES